MNVLIIGAGPAGTSCAIELLKAGIPVTLLDRVNFPRHAPGETLHPGVESLLYHLDVLEEVKKENYLQHKGIISEYQGQTIFDPYDKDENWLGYQLFRESFDKILVDKAVSLGAVLYQGCIIKEIRFDLGKISSIITTEGELKANYYIDATGKSCSLARRINIKYKVSSPKLIAYYGYVYSNDEVSRLDNPKMIWDQDGWLWIARVTKDLICWNKLTFLNKKLPMSWVPEQLEEYKSVEPRKAVDVTWRIADHSSRHNYFLVGDAAFVLDPSSSHGVLKAMMSGIMCAYLINKSQLKRLNISDLQQEYNHWIINWYKNDLQQLKALYREKHFAWN